ncbi:MAG: hypothetical protein H6765_07710 [Candidatus Peribacteria bacterium]|nr:MAG: hypothetical protein H6765_07710 [Candidatus Peribacteria bacterium]
MQITISFEDMYHGVEKEISYNRQVQPSDVTAQSCSNCHGSGYVTQQARTPFGVMQTQAPCPQCGGAGQEFFKDGAKLADGGMEQIKQSLKVKVPVGIKPGTKIRYPGMGNDGKLGGPSGDLYIQIAVK